MHFLKYYGLQQNRLVAVGRLNSVDELNPEN